MNRATFGFADGVSSLQVWLTGAVLLLWLVLLLLEQRQKRAPAAVWLSGIAAALLLAAAVLRPTRVMTRGNELGPKVVVLVDRSQRLDLKTASGATRQQVALDAARAVQRSLSSARVTTLGFGDGEPKPLDLGDPGREPRPIDSDLQAALAALAQAPGERPKAVVVISDGRLSSPGEGASDESLRALGERLGAPVHAISVDGTAPPDAAIRSAFTAGAAVAHQPLALRLEIACSGGLACDELPVTVAELLHGEPPALLAQGVAKMTSGSATLELPITLERAGRRLVEVRLGAPEGDRVPENDSRILTFDVARERVRILHVAGRPTYDVRALRMWLKGDESIDLVAFFILRTNQDDPQTRDDSELALIPFPVDELFTEHLPSFDAVVLQDIDAVEYKLERHLPALARYVRAGGGLIMVGGPSAFLGGGYAGSPLSEVLPVALPEQGPPFDTLEFEPRTTASGRAAPPLRAVRELLGDQLPRLVGSNSLGPARSDAIVLWEHPDRSAGGAPMPVLALGEAGDGRAIALGVDGTHALAWSELGERRAGRAYGALWEGLVGWLMRDPRYEAARVELTRECRAGEPVSLSVTRLPGDAADVTVDLERLGSGAKALLQRKERIAAGAESTTVPLGALEEGGYSALVRIGSAPPARFDFACERGGAAFADSRPDVERLFRLARATSGASLTASEANELPVPPATQIAAERSTTPLLPAWSWSLLAAAAVGVHWYVRRKNALV